MAPILVVRYGMPYPVSLDKKLDTQNLKAKTVFTTLTRDAEIVLYSLNGEKDSLLFPPSLKKRLGINPEEVIGFCMANDSYWFNTPNDRYGIRTIG